MPNISSYGKAGMKGMKKGSAKRPPKQSAQATMRKQQADLERRRAQREKTKRK